MPRHENPILTPVRVGAFLALVTVAFGLVLAVRSWTSVRTAEQVLFVEAPFMMLVAIGATGIALIGRGWPRREGERLHCARCGHPWSPEIDKLHSQCQECGAPWRHYGGRVEGKPTSSRLLILSGISLLAVALSVPILQSFNPSLLVTGRSTAYLTRKVTATTWENARAEWAELTTRTLTEPELLSLAARILDRRLRDGILPDPQARWMQSQIDLGTIPKELSDRWLAEMFEAQLDAPSAVALNEPVHLTARARFYGPWRNAANPAYVFLEGLTVDGVPGVSGRETTARPAERFGGGTTLYEETIFPEKPGTLRVTLAGWFVLGTMDTPIVYDPDGLPELLGCLYTRRFVLTKEIEVLKSR